MSPDEVEKLSFDQLKKLIPDCVLHPKMLILHQKSSISPRELILLGIILGIEKKNGNCAASNDYFAKVLGVSNSHINEMINFLIEEKLIKRTTTNEYTRHLNINPTLIK